MIKEGKENGDKKLIEIRKTVRNRQYRKLMVAGSTQKWIKRECQVKINLDAGKFDRILRRALHFVFLGSLFLLFGSFYAILLLHHHFTSINFSFNSFLPQLLWFLLHHHHFLYLLNFIHFIIIIIKIDYTVYYLLILNPFSLLHSSSSSPNCIILSNILSILLFIF